MFYYFWRCSKNVEKTVFFDVFCWKVLKTIAFSLFFSIFWPPQKRTQPWAPARRAAEQCSEVLKNIEFSYISEQNCLKHSGFLDIFGFERAQPWEHQLGGLLSSAQKY